MSNLLLTIDEAAQHLRLHPSSVRRMIAAGALPAVRVGRGRGRLRIRKSDLERALVPVEPRTAVAEALADEGSSK